MRVSLVIGQYDAQGGGAERWTDQHTRMLLDAGHEVHLFARRFRGAPDGAECHLIETGRTSSGRRMRFAARAERLVRAFDSDVIHDMGDGWHADLLMPHHGTRRGEFRNKMRYLPQLERWSRQIARRCLPRYIEFEAHERRQYDLSAGRLYLAVSRMIGEQMQSYYHVPADRVRVVHNGIDVSRFRPASEADRRRIRQALGVGDETLFLTVALDFKRKGVETLVRAMGRLVDRRRDARLVVVGDGPISRTQALARSLGCHRSIRFVGDQPDPLAYYQAADVFVLPTFYDPCSLVVLEALATGLPSITTRKNGVHEIIEPGRQGEIIDEPSDDESLADAMDLYLDRDRRRETGLAARALAESYSVEHMFRRHLQVYEEILARKRETRPDAVARPAPSPAGGAAIEGG
ncbi:MAG: glycosyltransferase family 4 protein [Planctomycetota bacterium]|jgi:UDP-glucose:(heptosyl)LPS alpha-1,3-glucosyltransferase